MQSVAIHCYLFVSAGKVILNSVQISQTVFLRYPSFCCLRILNFLFCHSLVFVDIGKYNCVKNKKRKKQTHNCIRVIL